MVAGAVRGGCLVAGCHRTVWRAGLLRLTAHARDRHPAGPGRAGERRSEAGCEAWDVADVGRYGDRSIRLIRVDAADQEPVVRRERDGPGDLHRDPDYAYVGRIASLLDTGEACGQG